jgi:thioesterase domain-containing protein
MTGSDTREKKADAARLSCHAIESMMCEIWGAHFGCAVSPDDDFYELGGDSLAMIEIVLAARDRGLALRSSVALRNPSPARLAESLTVGGERPSPDRGPAWPAALYPQAPDRPGLCSARWTEADTRPVPIFTVDGTEPLYVVHSDSHVPAERTAVAQWGGGRTLSGFLLPGARGPIPPVDSVGALAARFADALRRDQAAGPYRLAGFGQGAVVAFEMARRLREDGGQVELLALIDPPAVGAAAGPPLPLDELLRERVALLARRFALTGAESTGEIHAAMREAGWYDGTVAPADLARLQLAWAQLALALQDYEPSSYDGPVLLFQDGMNAPATGQTWRIAAKDLYALWLDYGTVSPRAVLRDPDVARAMRGVLAP